MTIDTKKLRELAEAATPGPWEVGEDERECAATLRARPVNKTTGKAYDPVDVIIPFGRAHSDAAFIAAVNPQTVIAVLDRLDELEDFRLEHIHDAEAAHDREEQLKEQNAAFQFMASRATEIMAAAGIPPCDIDDHELFFDERVKLLAEQLAAANAEIERLRDATQCMVCGTSEQQNNHCWDCVKARIKGHVAAIQAKDEQLAAMTKARDEACDLADRLWRDCANDKNQLAQVTKLRKVGQ